MNGKKVIYREKDTNTLMVNITITHEDYMRMVLTIGGLMGLCDFEAKSGHERNGLRNIWDNKLEELEYINVVKLRTEYK